MELQIGQKYKHYKGKEYVIVALGRHSETLEEMVVYQGLYSDPEFGDSPVWVRPQSMFIESVTFEGVTVKRFTRV